MNFPDVVRTCFQKYVVFNGRAARSEYWFWVLFTFIGSFVLGIVDGILGMQLLGGLFTLAVLLPSISVGVRRLHDIDKSGWWILINLIPIIGLIVFIFWAVTKGTAGDNRFGADPLA